jgi:hypothetical protein
MYSFILGNRKLSQEGEVETKWLNGAHDCNVAVPASNTAPNKTTENSVRTEAGRRLEEHMWYCKVKPLRGSRGTKKTKINIG